LTRSPAQILASNLRRCASGVTDDDSSFRTRQPRQGNLGRELLAGFQRFCGV
jgi:hypothetical protein